MNDAIEIVRQEWEEAHRRLESERADVRTYERRIQQVEVLTDELRRRVGQTFALRELADAYRDAERWSREAVAERAAAPHWSRDLSLVQGAAFHAYQRGAVDFAS